MRRVCWAEPRVPIGPNSPAYTRGPGPHVQGDSLGNLSDDAPVRHAPEIGMTPGQATAFSAAASALENSMLAQEAAKQGYRTATETVTEDYNTLKSLAGDAVRTIRAFAENSDKPGDVYALAQIPAPAAPSPIPPPGKPVDLGATLNPTTGEITVSWKAVNPAAGTSYLVMRKLPGQSEFTFVGVTGTKKFTDSTFTAGPDRVEYAVQGQRAGASGPISNALVINFGRAGGDSVITSVSEAA